MIEGPPFLREHDRIRPGDLRGQFGPYLPPPGLLQAANTAIGLGMPLLLTGDPGTGKSDFAWVAALALNNTPPLRCQIRSTTTARELLYHYDALVRFTDAQSDENAKLKSRDPRHYIRLRPLGVALMSRSPTNPPVVLVDEIDKAPPDLPNDLLWELDEGHFEIPEIADDEDDSPVRDPNHEDIPLRRIMRRDPDAAKPLVVITSNSERQLPDAFLRRCAFFHIPRPKAEKLREIAIARARDRTDGPPPEDLLESLLRIFEQLRAVVPTNKPTTAEMLQWIEALTRLHDRDQLRSTITVFETAFDQGDPPPWSALPGLSCLVKLREDLEQLVPRAG